MTAPSGVSSQVAVRTGPRLGTPCNLGHERDVDPRSLGGRRRRSAEALAVTRALWRSGKRGDHRRRHHLQSRSAWSQRRGGRRLWPRVCWLGAWSPLPPARVRSGGLTLCVMLLRLGTLVELMLRRVFEQGRAARRARPRAPTLSCACPTLSVGALGYLCACRLAVTCRVLESRVPRRAGAQRTRACRSRVVPLLADARGALGRPGCVEWQVSASRACHFHITSSG